jgi:hypothetical protein
MLAHRSFEMKHLLAATALIALLLAILWILGSRVSEHRASIRIHAARAVVFPHLVEPVRLSKWIEGLVSSEPLTEGGPRLGARSRETVEGDGNRMQMDSEITAFEQDSLLEVRLTSGMMTGRNRFVLTGATVVEQTFTLHYHGFARLLAPFLKGSVQKKLESDLARLKALAEAPQ